MLSIFSSAHHIALFARLQMKFRVEGGGARGEKSRMRLYTVDQCQVKEDTSAVVGACRWYFLCFIGCKDINFAAPNGKRPLFRRQRQRRMWL